MKILLAVKSMKMENLGVMYLSAVAKQAGHECSIVEFRDVLKFSKAHRHDIMGFSVMTGDQSYVKSIIDSIPQQRPAILVGGPHGTFFPEDFDDSPINMVIEGEAEQKFAELIGSTVKYPDLDSLPWPDRTDFPDMKIRDFITSRGCPYNCSYCYSERWHQMFDDLPRVRRRRADDVVNEVASTKAEFVYFQDSCFGTSMKWLREFSQLYKSQVNTPYHCHLRPNQVTEERVKLLSDSNCYSVRIALEAASTRLRKLLNRTNYTIADVFLSVRILKKYGIKVMIQNMLGLPTGTIEDDLETLEANIRAKPDYAWCSIFSPYPGTELGDFCKANGHYKGDYSDLMDNFFDTSPLEFSSEYKEQVECLQKVFALCVSTGYMPKAEELRHENFEKLVHKIMRYEGDRRLYAGVI